jgi:hypothetical protein
MLENLKRDLKLNKFTANGYAFTREIYRRLLKEKSLKRTIGFINFSISKKIPYFFSPLQLKLSITDRCNLKYLTCSHQYTSENKNDMNLHDFKYIIEQLPFLEQIEMTSFGESFLNKDFFKMLEYLKRRKISVSFTDNFTLLNEEMARKLLNLEIVDCIFASVDGADKETFEGLRPGTEFEDVLKNIRTVEVLKNELNLKIPRIVIISTISMKNIYNMVALVEMTKALNLKTIVFIPAIKMDGYPATYVNSMRELIPDASLYITEGGKAIKKGKQLNINVILGDIKCLASNCLRPWQEICIGYDGAVWPCCYIDYIDNNKECKPFGNIFKENFKSIWLSKDYRNLREALSKGKLTHFCSRKEYCIEDILSNKDLRSNLIIHEMSKYLQTENSDEIRSLGEDLCYMKDDRLLIITADDFGMCHSVNAATIEALESGLVTSCDIILQGSKFKEAAIYCKNNPEIDVGIHLTLTSEFDNLRYRPISPLHRVNSLVDPNGYFLKDGWLFKTKADIDEVYIELIAQIEYALEIGIKPTHLSSHMFILNCFGRDQQKFIDIIMDISKKYSLPFRIPYNKLSMEYKRRGFSILDNLIWESYYIHENKKKIFYKNALCNLKPGVNEIIIHCGYKDTELKSLTPWWARYEIDRYIFTSRDIRKYIEKLNIKLISWKALMDFQKKSLSREEIYV